MQRTESRMTGAGLESFIHRHGLTPRDAARSLGISERTLYSYLTDEFQMSQTLALLIKALDELWKRDGVRK